MMLGKGFWLLLSLMAMTILQLNRWFVRMLTRDVDMMQQPSVDHDEAKARLRRILHAPPEEPHVIKHVAAVAKSSSTVANKRLQIATSVHPKDDIAVDFDKRKGFQEQKRSDSPEMDQAESSLSSTPSVKVVTLPSSSSAPATFASLGHEVELFEKIATEQPQHDWTIIVRLGEETSAREQERVLERAVQQQQQDSDGLLGVWLGRPLHSTTRSDFQVRHDNFSQPACRSDSGLALSRLALEQLVVVDAISQRTCLGSLLIKEEERVSVSAPDKLPTFDEMLAWCLLQTSQTLCTEIAASSEGALAS